MTNADRKEFLEDQLERYVPSGVQVKLTNSPKWKSAEDTLVAEYDLQVTGWASSAGKRTLLPIGLFGNSEKHTFEHASRVHPLYFNFPYQTEDDITIELPAGWQASSVPPAHDIDLKVVAYHMAVTKQTQSLHIKRELTFNLLLLDKKFYPPLREFFQTVKSQDEQQVVIEPVKNPARR